MDAFFITVRGTGDPYVARAVGRNITASSTSSARIAAEACARKVLKYRPFKLTEQQRRELKLGYTSFFAKEVA